MQHNPQHLHALQVQRFVRLVRLLVFPVRGALSMTRPGAPKGGRARFV